MHINFAPKSGGGSTYTTSSADVMKGIEQHYHFGTLIHIESVKDDVQAVAKQPKVAEEAKKETEVRKVKVSDIGTAKDYLADTFGISRTSLRSAKSILEQAALHNIEFEGLE